MPPKEPEAVIWKRYYWGSTGYVAFQGSLQRGSYRSSTQNNTYTVETASRLRIDPKALYSTHHRDDIRRWNAHNIYGTVLTHPFNPNSQ
jgi:hypothetical protein